LIALGRDARQGGELWGQMITPHIQVNEHISWGLGVGIQHSQHGDSLWHWGSNLGSQSLMVYYPATGVGIVILTNSQNGADIYHEIAHHALGGKAYWQIF
ncbi:MAG: hypothetical protein AAF512_14855, partial [Pseudomonadota bacterium]